MRLTILRISQKKGFDNNGLSNKLVHPQVPSIAQVVYRHSFAH